MHAFIYKHRHIGPTVVNPQGLMYLPLPLKSPESALNSANTARLSEPMASRSPPLLWPRIFLLTNNTKEFERIEGLKLENWVG